MHCEMGSIAARTPSASPPLLPPALALLPRASLPPSILPAAPTGQRPPAPPMPKHASRLGLMLGLTPRPPPACSLPDDRPRQRSAPMAHRELASVPGHHCPRTCAAPRSSSHSSAPALAPPALHLPRPTGPPSHPLDLPSIRPRRRRPAPPRDLPRPRPRLPALAFSTAAPRSSPGRARMGWPRATVPPVQRRRRRATTPAAQPRDAPTRRPAHRLSHGLSGPRRPPLARANAPVSEDDPRGEGFAPNVGRLLWSIHLTSPTGSRSGCAEDRCGRSLATPSHA